MIDSVSDNGLQVCIKWPKEKYNKLSINKIKFDRYSNGKQTMKLLMI